MSVPKLPVIHNLLHDPALAESLDTSPAALHLSPQGEDQNDNSPSAKGRVMRAVEKTVDRLGKGIPNDSSACPQVLSSRRLFSINRKSKQRGDDKSEKPRPTSPHAHVQPGTGTNSDDSPFIRPGSPSLPPQASRPPLQPFRGEGSMHRGTQTLIQVLQAIPWTDEPDNDDDITNHDFTPADSESDEDVPEEQYASSIHTIHRPVARSRRADAPPSPAIKFSTSSRVIDIESHSPLEAVEEPDHDVALDSGEEIEQGDFEATPIPAMPEKPSPMHQPMSYPLSQRSGQPLVSPRITPSRAGSMVTVRLQRRARLAEKLRDVFELPGIEEVWAEMPCWLLRSILLQGYMYLTNSCLCFFAHMPTREDQILKSGSLTKKANRTKRWVKHWFVLKNDALSWYQSSSDPYFPHGIVDLRYAISCDPVNEKEFRLRTNQKTIIISSDSVPSREEWVKAIRKVIFKAQNMGDSVKIAIPYPVILDVEKSSAMDFSETIEVKVFDKEEHFSIDSYFFAYFHDLATALDQIRDAVRAFRLQPQKTSPDLVLDTTMLRGSHPPHGPLDRSQSLPNADHTPKSSSPFRLTSLLRPFHDTHPLGRSKPPDCAEDGEDFTHISKRGSHSFIPVTTSPQREASPAPSAESQNTSRTSTKSPNPTSMAPSDHTYPPSTSLVGLYPISTSSSTGSWGVGVPSWLKTSSRRGLIGSFGSGGTMENSASATTSVSEVYSFATTSRGQGDMGYSVLETPDMTVDTEVADKFRSHFAFDERETLLGYFHGYIFRLLPLYGRLYISTNHFCFRSSGPLTSKTWMILPIRDILATEKSRATRFGHHGLIIIVKGHEELFFEFGDEGRRKAFVVLLERQMEDVRKRQADGDNPSLSQGKRDALTLEEFEARGSQNSDFDPQPNESMTDSLPAVMFTSASSTFLTFKPKESLRFTFLTIGSRGDVQPYIALAKGLLADGHRVKIATHGEFKEWIEAQGIEYGYVGGDPAELMRICVENGTFTVSFLKEGLQKFRGWLDDLLKTSWEACQNTDVLVESPSAMGGYHIAEALSIPYFRAFTMTWTRTRAYPHAFAVPERKMGGGYNYMTYVMFDQVFWRATSGQINRWRRNILQLDSTSLDKMEPHKIPFLYNFSPVVVPPPLDWPEWIRVTGYWFLDDADVSSKKWEPPSDLVGFIDSAHNMGKKVVYIGFGSIVVSDPKTMTRFVIEAIVKSGVHAILSKGWSDRLHLKTGTDVADLEEALPPQIYSISAIPHDWLFQRIDAACHHGGAGTTGASLRAGIPTIVKPFFGDQFCWADRVEALGVGSGVRKLTVEHLTEALVAATTDAKQIGRAKLIGEQIRSEDGVATAIESIYRDMEYARTLIKRPPTDIDSDAEDATIKDHNHRWSSRSSPHSGGSAPSEDWSVISDQDDHRSSFQSHNGEGSTETPSSHKRNSLAVAMLSA